jgi:hypothetical protein
MLQRRGNKVRLVPIGAALQEVALFSAWREVVFSMKSNIITSAVVIIEAVA